MSGRHDHAERVAELIRQRRQFVRVTVVRAQCPASARPGDAAIVLPDGTIEGFVGGQCAEESVRTAAIEALREGEAVLLRILPGDDVPFPETPGAVTVTNPCLSGGALELFLEPNLPAARIVVVGNTPIADALIGFGTALGFAMETAQSGGDGVRGATAVVIASHGREEPEMIRAALDAGVNFVGLVASGVRGKAVIDALELDDAESARVRCPVGDDLGARTADEIALSIAAQLVRAIRREGLRAPIVDAPPLPQQAIDPICSMTVTVTPTTPHAVVDGTDYWFCNPGCRTRFVDEHVAA